LVPMIRPMLVVAILRLSQQHLWAVLQKRHESCLKPSRAVMAGSGGKVEPLAAQPAIKIVSELALHCLRLSCSLADAPVRDL